MFTSYSDSKIRICYVIIKPYFSARFLLIFAYIYLGNIPFLCIRKPNYMLKRTLCLIVLALLASPFLFAQVTTSAISGSIKSTTDETLVGASVVAIHVPSGTKYVALSRLQGHGNKNICPLPTLVAGKNKNNHPLPYLQGHGNKNIRPLTVL